MSQKFPDHDTPKKISRNVVIIIPVLNEEIGIAGVLQEIQTLKQSASSFVFDTIVVDNGSTDNTATVASRLGAQVIHEKKRGKGNALRIGFKTVNNSKKYDFVVILDGDNSHKPKEIPRLLEPLVSDFADVIVGSRLSGKAESIPMKTTNRLANWLFTFLVRHLFLANITDVCSGFVAWKGRVLNELQNSFVSEGFSIETEMTIKAARMGFRIYSVPITYSPGKSHSKIKRVRDSMRILATIFRLIYWKPPVTSHRES